MLYYIRDVWAKRSKNFNKITQFCMILCSYFVIVHFLADRYKKTYIVLITSSWLPEFTGHVDADVVQNVKLRFTLIHSLEIEMTIIIYNYCIYV